MVMMLYGFVAEPVKWQIVTLPAPATDRVPIAAIAATEPRSTPRRLVARDRFLTSLSNFWPSIGSASFPVETHVGFPTVVHREPFIAMNRRDEAIDVPAA